MSDIVIDDSTQLPDTHPLVKAYAAEREKNKTLKAEVAANADAVEKAKKYDEAQAASRTELEKAQARADAAEKALNERAAADEKAKAEADAAAEAKKVRAEVAKAKGVPESALRGSSKEEFEEHADELIAAGIKPKPAPSSDGQGDTGSQVSETDEKSADELVAAALDR